MKKDDKEQSLGKQQSGAELFAGLLPEFSPPRRFPIFCIAPLTRRKKNK